ncbi:hypothetical protein H311_01677, partial [Anncaliia algerae PRA109]
VIQVDETAIFHGSHKTCTSFTYDDFPKTTWLLEYIESNICRIYMEIAKIRNSASRIILFIKYIHTDAKVITNGFDSYPQAISLIKRQHI